MNDGLEADVVSLAMWPDTDLIRRSGLIAEGWEDRLPEKSLPYYSTIVFVVRKGNPKNIHDWADIVKPGVRDHHAESENVRQRQAELSWRPGARSSRAAASEAEAKEFVTKCYTSSTPVLDAAARAATMTFSKKNIGDVHLTWENEGQQEVQESEGRIGIGLSAGQLSRRAARHLGR